VALATASATFLEAATQSSESQVFPSTSPHCHFPLFELHTWSEQSTSKPQQYRSLSSPPRLALQSSAQFRQSSPSPGEQMPSPQLPVISSLQSSKQFSHVSPPSASHTPSMTQGLQFGTAVFVHDIDPGVEHASSVHGLPSLQSEANTQHPAVVLNAILHLLARLHTATSQLLTDSPNVIPSTPPQSESVEQQLSTAATVHELDPGDAHVFVVQGSASSQSWSAVQQPPIGS
jgi:hypothetical protein